MSHVISGEVIIKDLDCLTRAVATFGGKVVQKNRYNWYGEHVGDYPMPKGMTAAQLGRCECAIQLPNTCYEVGVVKQQDGTYTLAYDFYGTNDPRVKWKQGDAKVHDGGKLLSAFGPKLAKLQQQYNKQLVTKQARQHGYMVTEKLHANGSIKLQLIKA